MKIKIELEGLTLEQATGLTHYLSGFNPVQVGTDHEKQVLYPKEVRRPYSQEIKTVHSLEEEMLFMTEIKEDKPKQTRKRAEKVEAPIIETQEDESPEDAQEETKIESYRSAKHASSQIEATEVIEPEAVSVPTLMQIRSLVAQKAGEHKDVIKAKLVELGAQNVSTLDAKHFKTIFDFLTEL